MNRKVLPLILLAILFVVRVGKRSNSYYSVAASEKQKTTVILGPYWNVVDAQKAWVDYSKKLNLQNYEWAWGNERIFEFNQKMVK